jgi:hypothetical protein
MPFERHQPNSRLSKEDRRALLRDYFADYRLLWEREPSALNRKLPREVFRELLDEIGGKLLSKARELADQPGPIRQFLNDNPLPEQLSKHLPDDFRVFCLALNALKVWVSAEQAATDRYLLGAKARTECRDAATTCIVTGEPLISSDVELHHPVRDGRPPIPLSQKGHDRLENQAVTEGDDSVRSKLLAMKKAGNRSWVQLRRGCLDLAGKKMANSTRKVDAGAKTFARKASQITGLNYDELLLWLDENGK